MLKKFFLSVVLVAWSLFGVENAVLRIDPEPLGGGLRGIFYLGQALNSAGCVSFTEEPHAGQDKIITVEQFNRLPYTIEPIDALSFSARVRGQAAFENLELLKTYTLSPDTARLTVKYQLFNRGQSPLAVALRVKTFLRGGEVSDCYLPQEDGLNKYRHPGTVLSQWSRTPKEAFIALANAQTGAGVLLLPPPQYTCALLTWYSSSQAVSTAEVFTPEFNIPPGGSQELEFVCQFDADIPTRVADLQIPVPESTLPRSLWVSLGTDKSLKLDIPRFGALPESSNLIANSSFEQPTPDGTLPAGHPQMLLPYRRKILSYEKGDAPDGEYRLGLHRHDNFAAMVKFDFPVNAGKEYEISAYIKCITPVPDWSRMQVSFFNSAKDSIPHPSTSLLMSKQNYDWTNIRRRVLAPPGSVTGQLYFRVYAPGGKMWLDNVQVIELSEAGDRLTILRNRLQKSWYAPLDLIEQLNPSLLPPPAKNWFNPAANAMPEVLFLCNAWLWRMCDTDRLLIHELSQRMEFKYQYHPLLRRIMTIGSGAGQYGVNNATYANDLEPYTLEQLRRIEAVPGAIIIHGIDFANHVQPEFIAILENFQRLGAGLLFSYCQNVPAELLGQKIPTPPGFFAVPVMRVVPQRLQDSSCSIYANKTAIVDFGRADWPNFRNLPAAPQERLADRYFVPGTWDFNFQEYIYPIVLKALRYVAGVRSPVRFNKSSGTSIELQADTAQSVLLSASYSDLHGGSNGKSSQPVTLQEGKNQIELQLPALPGGIQIIDCQILDLQGRVYDVGSLRYETPEEVKISAVEFKNPDCCFVETAPIEFTVAVQGQADLAVVIEDSERRVVYRESRPAAAEHQISVSLQAPYSTLYNVFLALKDGERTLAKRTEEFSLPFQTIDPQEYHGFLASFWRGGYLLPEWGFNLTLGSFNTSSNFFRSRALLGLHTIPRGSGLLGKGDLLYRGDKISDPVRVPCFSDPEWQKQQREKLLDIAKQAQFRYYNVARSMLGDEMFVGASVCYSPHCLRRFREYLQGRYADLAALNAGWGSAFASWEEVRPQQLTELASKENLSPWLEHKMFMSATYTWQFGGYSADCLSEALPHQVGLSGTQHPGYGYDWSEWTKLLGFVGYYSGIQGKLILDLGRPGLLAGQCTGGYTAAHLPAEGYQSDTAWRNLFLGANLCYYYYGSGINGDMTPNVILRSAIKILREQQRGVGKLILSARPAFRHIAMLYSQASMFAALGSIGKNDWLDAQTGWDAVLTDLGYDYHFIRSEDLAAGLAEFKVLVLPMCLSLSDQELTAMRDFAAHGGLIIADSTPGLYDGYGKKLSRELSFSKTLSLPLHRYHQVELGGVGGELATSKSGSSSETEQIREQVSAALAATAIPRVSLTSQGLPYPAQTTLRRDGDNYVFGLFKRSSAAQLTPEVTEKVDITLPVNGHIYDIFSGEYLGQTERISADVALGIPKIYSIGPGQPGALGVRAPAEVSRGELLQIVISGGLGASVFRLELIDPNGRSLRQYSKNYHFATGDGAVSWQSAYNDLPGEWQIEATHINTKRTIRQAVTFK